MKNLLKKINSFGLAAILVAAMVMSSQSILKAENSSKFDLSWFSYDGPTFPGGEGNPNNYTNIGDQPTNCGGQGSRCAIQANVNTATNKPVAGELASPNAELLHQ